MSILTPTTFWGAFALAVAGGHAAGQDAYVFALCAIPFVWAGSSGGKKDPLTAVMLLLALVMLLGAGCAIAGLASYFIMGFSLLFAIAYALAPRRSYPTAAAYTEGMDLTARRISADLVSRMSAALSLSQLRHRGSFLLLRGALRCFDRVRLRS